MLGTSKALEGLQELLLLPQRALNASAVHNRTPLYRFASREHVIFEFGMCDLVNQNETDSVRIKTNGLQ